MGESVSSAWATWAVAWHGGSSMPASRSPASTCGPRTSSTAGATALPSPAAVMAESTSCSSRCPTARWSRTSCSASAGSWPRLGGPIVVDLSTSSPESTRRIGGSSAAKRVSFLDAGISGGAAAAESGTLTLMVGGDEAGAGSRPRHARPVQHHHLLLRTERVRPHGEDPEQLPQRGLAQRDRRDDGRGEEGRTRPVDGPRHRQRQLGRQLRDAEPLPEDHPRRLPEGRADEQP